MSSQQVRSNDATASVASVDMKLEVSSSPSRDVDRAKEFYSRLGWPLDAYRTAGNNGRLFQFTTPGSAARSNSGVAVLGLGGCLGALNAVLCLSARMRWLFSYEYRKYLAEAPDAAYSEDAGTKLVFDSKPSRSKRFTCADIPPGVL